ncbi:S8 family serine peptidase [Planctomicrobium sp. SH661]|uniref:S8 family serine peptidase n=1 Tax=Planctomicrobium sp. SH661 TaxID=3448124 RepID=UPI003F5CAD77
MIQKAIVLIGLFLLSIPVSFGWDAIPASGQGFPIDGILPKKETGALRFLQQHPEYDGRGVLVAIFDTGVDPGAPGLSVTTDGKPKIVDLIDATGSGDVPLSKNHEAKEGVLTSLTDRPLKVNLDWKNPSGQFHLGVKPGYDIFPPELVERLTKERKRKFELQQRALEAELRDQLERIKQGDDKSLSKVECEARLKELTQAWKDYQDPGPVYDCVVFHDGEHWRAVIDTDEDGDLSDEKALTNYAVEREFASFSDASRLNFSVNIYEEGELLSIVTTSGEHGTHVAGIVAAHDSAHPERNGLAPGAQLVSIKIGDTRMDSMETGTALMRALQATVEHRCDLINMSYGEPTSAPNQGALIDAFNEIVREKGVIFVASAGNDGPGISTVGAPGGTTSALIGVGAYVSPEMMEVEYSLRDPGPGQAYTWSSRGPTMDGAAGVDIFAPGGAIAPIPAYALQPGRQMNGTSMASPNACGNIALMLSGFKNLNQTYTPISVLRSLQATAEQLPDIDSLAQGPGLLQVDRAFEHHTQWNSAPGQHVELEVTIPNRRNARGIYLREQFETDHVYDGELRIEPYFSVDADPLRKLEYEIPLKLVATADWIHLGEHLLLASGEDRIPVRVDPTQLEPGLHVAEILGFDASQPERGPLFRTSVVITKPEPVEESQWEANFESDRGRIARHFLSVPAGATSATLRFKRIGGDAFGIFVVHALQLSPGESFEQHDTKFPIGLLDQANFERSIPVLGGRTLELCIAQYWSNPGNSELQLEATFHGLTSDQSRVVLPGDAASIPVAVTSNLRVEKCSPSASLTRWERLLAATSATDSLLTPERDGLWDGRRMSQLVLTYELNLPADAQVTIECPELKGLLYELPIDSFRMLVFDEHQQLIHSDDTQAEAFSLKKGKYTIKVELRDLDREHLEKFESLVLVAGQSLASPVTVSIDDNRTKNLLDLNEFGEQTLAVGTGTTLFLHLPSDAELPESMETGDRLTGELKLAGSQITSIPLLYEYKESAPEKEESASEEKSAAKAETFDLKTAQLQFWLTSMKSLSWPQDQAAIDELFQRVIEEDPENREARVIRLHLLDNNEREQRLPEIVAAADDVLKLIDQRKLRRYFARRRENLNEEQKKTLKDQESQKKDLLDALYRKGRAVGYMELPEVVGKYPVLEKGEQEKLFEATYKDLASWVDMNGPDYFLLKIRRERRHQNFGQALELLNWTTKTLPEKELYLEKRRILYGQLGWKAWEQNQQAWIWRKFPKMEVPF